MSKRKLAIGSFIFSGLFVLSGLILLNLNQIKAGGGPCDFAKYSKWSVSKSTARIGEEVAVTLNINCDRGDYENDDASWLNSKVKFSSSSPGVSISPSSGCTNARGYFSVKVKASSVGTKTIRGYKYRIRCGESWWSREIFSAGSASINFVSSEATAPSTTPGTPAGGATDTSQEVIPPTVTAINGEQLADNKILNEEIIKGEDITFSGTTKPESTVKLFIYSDEPIEVETLADKDGNWEYTLTEDLEVGEHKVEGQVIDKNGKESEREIIARFTISEEGVSEEAQTEESKKYPSLLIYILLGLGLIFVGVGIYLILRKRKEKQAIGTSKKE